MNEKLKAQIIRETEYAFNDAITKILAEQNLFDVIDVLELMQVRKEAAYHIYNMCH